MIACPISLGRIGSGAGRLSSRTSPGQVVMGAQITMELPAMRLLDDEDAFDAVERRLNRSGCTGNSNRGAIKRTSDRATHLFDRLTRRTRQ